MDCQASNIEIQTIITRIVDGDINLQPDFQRGEVWSLNKKKKLIDSILRGWNIPPIHVVENSLGIDEVLDGQQRLISIRDFCDNVFSIDGGIAPIDKRIADLDGIYYNNLPDGVKRKFNKYLITIVRLSQYKPEEPAELFYRLNQPATLTAAEQRNAYIGKTRSQIKELVKDFERMGADKTLVGFSNSRLAYDEIISKFAFMVEEKTLKKKITAGNISNRYRSDMEFQEETIAIVRTALNKYANILIEMKKEKSYLPKFSKATMLSWLIFVKRHCNNFVEDDLELIFEFEGLRDYLKGKLKIDRLEMPIVDIDYLMKNYVYLESMMNLYNQRSSMGSTDALSVIYRDIIINIFYNMLYKKNGDMLKKVEDLYNERGNFNATIEQINIDYSWGTVF